MKTQKITEQKPMKYQIFHLLNFGFEWKEDSKRKFVGSVSANSLEEAFSLSQNLDSPWNEANPCRSTSIGDVIQEGDEFFLVNSIGFTPAPNFKNVSKIIILDYSTGEVHVFDYDRNQYPEYVDFYEAKNEECGFSFNESEVNCMIVDELKINLH